jgi:hypothetical protein
MRSKKQMDKLNAFIDSFDDPKATNSSVNYLIWVCPQCRLLFSTTKYGWSSRWKTIDRSDGKTESNNKSVPPWIKCPHCISVIDFEKFQNAKDNEETLIEGDRLLDIAPMHLLLEPADYLNLAKSDNTNEEAALNFNLHAWHRFNDLRESEGSLTLLPNDSAFLELILTSLKGESRQIALYKAELLRELGKFDEATAVLDREFYEEKFESYAEQIQRAVEQNDSIPFLFATNERDGNYEFMMAWRTRRYVPEIPAETDEILDPPIFKINNRNWWIKVLGMLSHNWALIEENSDKTATVYFFQDTPEPRRPEIIDSLHFVSIEKAQQGLRRNQFSLLKKTPGPWLGDVPKGHFYDNRSSGNLIYSKLGYWED